MLNLFPPTPTSKKCKQIHKNNIQYKHSIMCFGNHVWNRCSARDKSKAWEHFLWPMRKDLFSMRPTLRTPLLHNKGWSLDGLAWRLCVTLWGTLTNVPDLINTVLFHSSLNGASWQLHWRYQKAEGEHTGSVQSDMHNMQQLLCACRVFHISNTENKIQMLHFYNLQKTFFS